MMTYISTWMPEEFFLWPYISATNYHMMFFFSHYVLMLIFLHHLSASYSKTIRNNVLFNQQI